MAGCYYPQRHTRGFRDIRFKVSKITQIKYKLFLQYKSRIDALHTFHVNLFDKILNRNGVSKNTPGM